MIEQYTVSENFVIIEQSLSSGCDHVGRNLKLLVSMGNMLSDLLWLLT